MESNHLWQDHRNGLSKHDSLGFDTTNTPSSDSKTVDHGGVRVCSHDRVWVEHVLSVEYDFSEVFKVYLMNNT